MGEVVCYKRIFKHSESLSINVQIHAAQIITNENTLRQSISEISFAIVIIKTNKFENAVLCCLYFIDRSFGKIKKSEP